MPGATLNLERPLAPPPRDVIRATETRALHGQGFAGTFANLVVATVTVLVVAPELASPWRLLPLLGILAPLVVRLATRRQPVVELADLLAWRRKYLLAVLLSGTAWGATVALTLPAVPFSHQVFIIVIAIGLSAGALATLGEVLAVFLAFVVPLLASTVPTIALSFGHEAPALGALIGLYALVLVKTSLVHAKHLTELLALSLRNEALVGELGRATDAARAASRAKSEFLTRMSHELRTPMNGILGAMEILLHADLPPRERHVARVAHDSGELLLALVNDVLDMARIEAGRIEICDAPLSVEALLDDVATLLCVSADQRGLALVCHAAEDVPRWVIGDATRLRQILTNLAGNAVKFTDAGEVEVRAALEPSPEGDALAFHVRDTGGGIPEDQHALIFRAFEQGRADVDAQLRGTGLGLAISARLAALMGGTITLASAVGRGSVFSLRIPCRRAATLRPEPPPTLSGRRVLLLVPQLLEREALARWLSDAGAEVVSCASDEALEAARAGVDVILLDPTGLTSGASPADAVGATPSVRLERPSAPLEEVGAGQAYPRPLQRGRVIAAVEAALGIRDATEARPAAPPPGGGARVLVVDDDTVNRLVAQRLLESLAVEVTLAESGPEALEVLAGASFDLVLMDCEMPGMDGREATRRARERDVRGRDGAPLPIIAATAHVMPEHHAACREAGMNDVVTKPISRAALAAVLARLTPERAGAA